MQEIVNGLPNIFFTAQDAQKLAPSAKPCYAPVSRNQFDLIRSSFGFALHMHQPTIPAGGYNLADAALVSNLQNMMENQNIGDNHNAPVFMNCYTRMADFVPALVARGKNPRGMLDYSGNLFWGLRQMEGGRVIENLKRITLDPQFQPCVEWTGTMWSHAVATSTPVPDIPLHILAWRKHFAAIFGEDAVKRVKGFSPPEMHLPIHPDVCYAYIKALKEAGYQWLMVQEHSVENLDGAGIRRPHYPHRLIARNSLGETVEIIAIVKTQGSDTKLVAQMQPYYEAKSRDREDYAGKKIPPFVFQIGDGENGGVMMNEFPPMFHQVFEEIGTQGTVGMNASEYLEFLQAAGVRAEAFLPIQPISQHRIWKMIEGKYTAGAADKAIDQIKAKDNSFNLDKGSWTSDRNWVKGYEDVLDPINNLSACFHKKFDTRKLDPDNSAYQQSLLYLLLSQTSCFRYWGSGVWTDYAKELCRRGMEAVKRA
ncbi:MAG: glycosyl hydrolase family 57 [Candidatus Omnitrophica bacterium]|nr:glycosyl hydrolase family 57 [Candidatus Omnitrophota bacterium]